MIRTCLVIPVLVCLVVTGILLYTLMEAHAALFLRFNGSNSFELLENCGKRDFDAREMRRRINLVREFTVENRKSPRETVVVLGIAGGMSEVFGNFISDSRIFFLPKVLNKIANYMKYQSAIGFPLGTALIENIFKCNFKEELLVHHLMKNETRLLSPTLVGAPECVAKEEYRAPLTREHLCIKVFSNWLTTKCRQSDIVIAQTDQIKFISSLNVLMTDTKSRSFSTRVVHVVRDPRAIVHDVSLSVTKQLTNKALELVSHRICTQMMVNFKTGENPPLWLQGRYHLVKIEDLLDGHKHISKLNDFLKEVNAKFANLLGDLKSLINNGKTTKWRSEMSSENVRFVESNCEKIMALLGYHRVKTEQILHAYM